MTNESDNIKDKEVVDDDVSVDSSSIPGPSELLEDPSKRLFFKRAAVGGGTALLGGVASYGAGIASLKGKVSEDYPQTDEKIFKPKDQRDVVLNFVSSKALNKKHPERNEQYNRLQKKEFNWVNGIKDMYSKPWDNSKPGYTQKDRVLSKKIT